jgi:hypothetical protein
MSSKEDNTQANQNVALHEGSIEAIDVTLQPIKDQGLSLKTQTWHGKCFLPLSPRSLTG